MNLKKFTFLTFLGTIAVFESGCASILSDSTYAVTINSFPDKAQFTVKNKSGVVVSQGTTPQQVVLKSGAGFFQPERYTINFKKQNYESAAVIEKAGLDPWYFGNIIFGELIGILIVDPATGAMWDLPDSISANLQPKSLIPKAPQPTRKSVTNPRPRPPKSQVKHQSKGVKKTAPSEH